MKPNVTFEYKKNNVMIDTPTIGDNRIKGLFLDNDYPINKENGTGFSDGTISEVLGNIFENKDYLIKNHE